MSIIRVARRRRYTVVSNGPIEDPQLSFRALGVLTYLLSKPDHWEVRVAELIGAHSEGRAAVDSALAELERAGYVTRDEGRDAAGRFTSTLIVHEQPVYAVDEPVTSPKTTKQQVSSSAGYPRRITRRGSPASDNPRLVSTEGAKTDQQTGSGGTDTHEASPEPAPPPPPTASGTEPPRKIADWAELLAIPGHHDELDAVLRNHLELVDDPEPITAALRHLDARGCRNIHASELRQLLHRHAPPPPARSARR